MKANTKKLLAMGLSVVLAVGCLTGCGGDSKSSSTSGDTARRRWIFQQQKNF